MAGCQCQGIGAKFDEPYAADKLARYRSRGPDPSTQALIEAILAEDVAGATLLDIGGGVGVIQHELLERGLARAQEVEASAAYVEACRTEAERQGHADRISHVVGDFDSVIERLEPADVVTLDRSVCCWHEPLALIDHSAGLARRYYGLVYPRDAWWVRYGWRSFGNLKQVVKRSGLRLRTPRTADIETLLARHGLVSRRLVTISVWQVALYARLPNPWSRPPAGASRQPGRSVKGRPLPSGP